MKAYQQATTPASVAVNTPERMPPRMMTGASSADQTWPSAFIIRVKLEFVVTRRAGRCRERMMYMVPIRELPMRFPRIAPDRKSPPMDVPSHRAMMIMVRIGGYDRSDGSDGSSRIQAADPSSSTRSFMAGITIEPMSRDLSNQRPQLSREIILPTTDAWQEPARQCPTTV